MSHTGPGNAGVGLPKQIFGTLYTYPDNPRISKIQIAAAYVNLKLDVQNLIVGKDTTTPEFLSKFPLGKLPVFEGKNGFTLFESNAIAHYIADQSSGHLLGTSTKENALIFQFITLCENEFIPAEAVWLFPLFGWIPENPTFTKKAKLDVKKALSLLEAHLLTKTYLVGEAITLADIAVATSLLQYYIYVFDKVWRNEFKNVTRWFITCINQKEFLAVLGEVKLCEIELTIKKETEQIVKKSTISTATSKFHSVQKTELKKIGSKPVTLTIWKSNLPKDLKKGIPAKSLTSLPASTILTNVQYRFNSELDTVASANKVIESLLLEFKQKSENVAASLNIIGDINFLKIEGFVAVVGEVEAKKVDEFLENKYFLKVEGVSTASKIVACQVFV